MHANSRSDARAQNVSEPADKASEPHKTMSAAARAQDHDGEHGDCDGESDLDCGVRAAEQGDRDYRTSHDRSSGMVRIVPACLRGERVAVLWETRGVPNLASLQGGEVRGAGGADRAQREFAPEQFVGRMLRPHFEQAGQFAAVMRVMARSPIFSARYR